MYTNAEITLKRGNIQEQSYTHDVNLCELKVFIWLLYFTDVLCTMLVITTQIIVE